MQEIYMEDTGSGYPLVLVHGYLGSSEMWNLQKEYLNKHFRIIAPALPGFGESHNIKSVDNINAMAKSVFQILDKKNIKRFSIIQYVIVIGIIDIIPVNIYFL